jgi:hypothetical protein
VSNASKGKGSSQLRDRPALLESFSECCEFLVRSAASYDEGYEAEAKRLAVTLRVLMHDTSASKSLLGQLGVKSRLAFTDTAEPIRPTNLMATPGLVIMKFTSTEHGSHGEYVPPLDMLSPGRIKPPVPFAAWWNNRVMKEQNGHTWSRRDFVTELASKEGGAHVDPRLNEQYERLARRNGLGWEVHAPGTGLAKAFTGNPVAASVRQIAFEVIDTFQRESIH